MFLPMRVSFDLSNLKHTHPISLSYSCDTNRILFARSVNWHQYFHCPIGYQPHTTGTSFLLLLFLYPRSFCCLSPIGRAEQASSIHLTLPCTGSISVGRVVRRFKGWPPPYSLASSRRATSSMRLASTCLAPATKRSNAGKKGRPSFQVGPSGSATYEQGWQGRRRRTRCRAYTRRRRCARWLRAEVRGPRPSK